MGRTRLKNIFEEGELQEEVVISKMETTTAHGATLVPYAKIFENDYNLSETSLHATMTASQLIGEARLVALWRKGQNRVSEATPF